MRDRSQVPFDAGRPGLKFRAPRMGIILVTTLAALYALTFSIITIIKYYTFNATFLDLGLQNEILWLTLHGSYFASGFSTVYPFPFDSLAQFSLLPIYALYPHPETLLVIQASMLGAGAIPTYLVTRRLCGQDLTATVVAVAYLLYFPLQGANMFDFHVEAMFPLLYLTATYFELRGNHFLSVPLFVLAGLVDLLALGIVALTLIGWLIHYNFERRARIGSDLSSLSKIRHTCEEHWPLLAALCGTMIFLLWILKFQPDTVGGTTTAISISTSSVLGNASQKIGILLILGAPLAFIFLFGSDGWLLVALPYVAFVFVSTSNTAAIPFYRQYPLLVTPILFIALIRALSHVESGGLGQTFSNAGVAVEKAHLLERAYRRLTYRRPITKYLVVLASCTLIFTAIYSPLSPLNPSLGGNVFNGNYDLPTVLNYTPHDRALWNIIGLIPNSASILTQNSIPQVSGRLHVEIAGYPLLNITPDYILGDSNTHTTIAAWSGWSQLSPYVTVALTNKTYGLIAYDDGIILLKHAYNGPPQILVPYRENFSANSFLLSTGYRSSSGALVHNLTLGNDSTFWYGPYTSLLLPGNYTATFSVKEINVSAPKSPLITLDVSANAGGLILTSYEVTTSRLVPGEWNTITLSFSISTPESDVEFRGLSVTNSATVLFDGVTLSYI